MDVGTGRRVIEVSAGTARVCALLDDGSVKCWGANSPSPGVVGPSPGANWLGYDLPSTNTSLGDEPGEMGDALPGVAPAERAISVVASQYLYTCAVLESGDVQCWGGRGSVIPIENAEWCPTEYFGVSSPFSLGYCRKVVSVAVGDWHACAILDTGQLKCWGGNEAGQLGLGDRETRGDDPSEVCENLPEVDLGEG